MSVKIKNKEAKIGDVIVGRSSNGELVVGPIIAINEKAGVVTVGALHSNSNTAIGASCSHLDDIAPAPKVEVKKDPAGTVTFPQ